MCIRDRSEIPVELRCAQGSRTNQLRVVNGQNGSKARFGPPVSPTSTLIDSHCHIVFRTFEEDLEDVAARWREAGVSALLHACVEPAEIPAIRSLADRFPEMRYSVGVHPLDTEHWCPDTVDVLREAALDDPCLLYTSPSPRDLSTSRMPSSA